MSKFRPFIIVVCALAVLNVSQVRAEPGAAIGAITTAVGLLKQINELNRGTQQDQKLNDISGRLQRIEAQLGGIEQKLDIAVEAILRLEKKEEAQRQKVLRGNVLGYIRAVNTYYPGWKKKCVKKGHIQCDEKTYRAVELKHNDLVNAIRIFMEQDDYSNIHIAVMGMGYERDLLVLMGTPEHNEAVFTRYEKYLENGVAHFEEIQAKLQGEMAKLEASAASWNTPEDFCTTGQKAWIYDDQGMRNCLYCLVESFSGNFRVGWKRTPGFAVRDGQGSANCTDRDSSDRMNEGVYRPVGGSCEYMREHRNCAQLQALEDSRRRYSTIQADGIEPTTALIIEVQKSITLARDWAAGKNIPSL